MKKKLINFLIIIVLILVVIYLYGNKIETHKLKVNEIKVTSEKISAFHGLKIVQISDIYYNNTTTIDDLKVLSNKVNLVKPDIIVFTGNIFDTDITTDELTSIVDIINSMNSTYGKYAISGEKDINNDNFTKLIDDTKINLIDDTYDTIYNNNNESIIIAGMSSKKGRDYTKIKETINTVSNTTAVYKILIASEPDDINNIDYHSLDMIMAGYTLGGTINIPLIRDIFLDEYDELYNKQYYLLDSTSFYISSGIGTRSIPLRLFNCPSINFYRIVKQ